MNQPIKYVLLAFFIVVVFLGISCFGNPQWHKSIYIWQAYYSELEVKSDYTPGKGPTDVLLEIEMSLNSISPLKKKINRGLLIVSDGFTGIWSAWDEDGNLLSKVRYKGGRQSGLQYGFHNRNVFVIISKQGQVVTLIYSVEKSIDLRPQYAKEIELFEAELAEFEAETK